MSRGLDHIDERRVAGDGSSTGGFVSGGATEFSLLAGDSLDLRIDDERRKPGWPVAFFAFAAVFALVGATALILPHLAPVVRGQAGATVPAGSRGHLCAQDPGDKDYCRRYNLDLSRRADLPADEHNRMLPETTALQNAVSAVRAPADHSPAAEADTLRSALVDDGYPGAVVRPARPDDPAPHGSLLFAVPLGGDCFVGHLRNLDSGWSYVLAGRLPDGSCVSP